MKRANYERFEKIYNKKKLSSFPPRLTWTLNHWKTTLKSHVYKGFPFIILFTTPIFAYLTYLIARCKTFRVAEYTNHLINQVRLD